MTLPVLAGTLSTVIFVLSYLPMLAKALRTRDVSSYSLSSLALTNVGNAIYSIYVFHLPVGPIWALHSFYLLATVLMLVWCIRYRPRRPAPETNVARLDDAEAGASPEASVSSVAG